ncbi:Chitinase 1 [Podila humilis]|nr:Chitinase 1 [Podila humilis]
MKFARAVSSATAIIAALSPVAMAYDPLARTNVVNYWGQNSVSYTGGQEAPLAEYCQDDTVDVFALAFIHQIQNGVPIINLASHCQSTFPGSAILSCPHIGKDIAACQARGKAIVMSIGGASGSYSLPDAQSGTAFADKVWDMFLGGSSTTRPFGDAVTLDGIDLDLESGQNAGYVAFIERLRSNFLSSAGKKFIITAAPQCPYPDQAAKEALAHSWFDMVWVQFYNNYCGTNAFGTSNFNFDVWNTWASTVSQNKNVRILLGVPGGPGAAGSGIVDAPTLNKILGAVKSFSHFGGVMFWDAGVAKKSGLASSASNFLKSGSRGVMEQPPKPTQSQPQQPPKITAPSVHIPTVTAPSIAVPVITAPAVPVVIKAPEMGAKNSPMATTLVVPADKKTVPTMTLAVPYGQTLKLSVRVRHENGGAQSNSARAYPAQIGGHVRRMETDWMGRPVPRTAVAPVQAKPTINTVAPQAGGSSSEDFDVLIEAKCRW